jgi:hypothetical protein
MEHNGSSCRSLLAITSKTTEISLDTVQKPSKIGSLTVQETSIIKLSSQCKNPRAVCLSVCLVLVIHHGPAKENVGIKPAMDCEQPCCASSQAMLRVAALTELWVVRSHAARVAKSSWSVVAQIELWRKFSDVEDDDSSGALEETLMMRPALVIQVFSCMPVLQMFRRLVDAPLASHGSFPLRSLPGFLLLPKPPLRGGRLRLRDVVQALVVPRTVFVVDNATQPQGEISSHEDRLLAQPGTRFRDLLFC